MDNNYPWVVNSGSGRGFHIIFKSPQFVNEENSISFEFSKQYRSKFSDKEYFGSIELRWKDHIVLPPSLAQYGGEYCFRHDSIPNSFPKEIGLNNIDELLYNVASEHKYEQREKQGLKYETANTKKLFWPWDSYLEFAKDYYGEDPVSWLKTSNTSFSRNTILLRYLDTDSPLFKEYAKTFLLNIESKDGYFNIASFMAVNILKGNRKAIDYCSARLIALFNFKDNQEDSEQDIKELTEYQHHFELIDNNTKTQGIPEGKLYLFVDTETTGLAINNNDDYRKIDNWPRLVQISWIMSSDTGIVLRKSTCTIYPDDFRIPESASKIHGIYQWDALWRGKKIDDVLSDFIQDVEKCDSIVGHNVSFDINIILAEMTRKKCSRETIELLHNKPLICTMKSTTNFCHIPAYRGFKYPTLQQLYLKLFGIKFEHAHNANADILATYKCFWMLKKKGIM